MSTRIAALIADLRTAADAAGLTDYQLSRIAGLHRNSLRHFRKGPWSPTVETIDRLERALGPETTSTSECAR